MKKLYLPCLFSKDCSAISSTGAKLFIPEIDGFVDMEAAREKAHQLALSDPKAQVVIFESVEVVEPRKIEFAHKKFNKEGELLA